MICLTGDVHHASLRINDQRFLTGEDTEVRVAQRYVRLLEKHGVKSTLYITGKCFTEEWADLEGVACHPLVEMGGHGFRARQPRPLFDGYGRLTGNWNGPRWFQAWDIRTNLAACRSLTRWPIVSWRSHSYKVDRNTYPLLAAQGVQLVSDEIRAGNLWPQRIAHGLISHPMNVLPDHDHLYHAHRTAEFVEKANRAGYGADEFGAVSYTVDEWGARVLEAARTIDERGGLVTILAHPLCMFLADGFRTLETLLAWIAGRQQVWAREIAALVDSPPPGLAAVPGPPP